MVGCPDTDRVVRFVICFSMLIHSEPKCENARYFEEFGLLLQTFGDVGKVFCYLMSVTVLEETDVLCTCSRKLFNSILK